MALSIQDPEVDRLARDLAQLTGLTLTGAVLKALREQMGRETSRSTFASLAGDLRAIGDRCAALPDLDTRSPDEIIGFDEFGIPR